MALTAWLPVFINEYHGEELFVSGCFTSFYAVLCSGTRSVSGTTTDRMGGDYATILGVTLITIGSLWWGFCPPYDAYHPINMTGLIITAMAGGFSNAACDKWIPYVSPGKVAPVGGLIGAFGACGGFILPVMFGYWANIAHRGYGYGLWSITVMAAISVLLSFKLKNILDNESAERLRKRQREEEALLMIDEDDENRVVEAR